MERSAQKHGNAPRKPKYVQIGGKHADREPGVEQVSTNLLRIPSRDQRALHTSTLATSPAQLLNRKDEEEIEGEGARRNSPAA